jgi:hypothetical protein
MGCCNEVPDGTQQPGLNALLFAGNEATEKGFLSQMFDAVAQEFPGAGGGVTEETHN